MEQLRRFWSICSWHVVVPKEWQSVFTLWIELLFRSIFSDSYLLTHNTPFLSSTKSRSIISVRLLLWYRTIQQKSNFLLNFWNQEDLVPDFSGGFYKFHHKLVSAFKRLFVDTIFTLIQSKDCWRIYPCSYKYVCKHYQGSLSRFCFCRVKPHVYNNICTTLCEIMQLLQSHFVAISIFCGTQYRLKSWQHEDILFFPLMTSQHTRTTIKGHIFASKFRWTMVSLALHPLVQ